jgi:hypothetical protein
MRLYSFKNQAGELKKNYIIHKNHYLPSLLGCLPKFSSVFSSVGKKLQNKKVRCLNICSYFLLEQQI